MPGLVSLAANPATKTVPAGAAAMGFNRLYSFEDYKTLSNVDLANAKTNNFDWFIDFKWPSVAGGATFWTSSWFDFPIQDSSRLSLVGSAIHSTQGGSGSLNNIASAAYIVGAPGYVGRVFGPGGYWEAKMKYGNITNFGTGFYMFPLPFFLGTATRLVEVDICEGVNNTTAQTNPMTWDVSVGPPPTRIAHDVQFSYSSNTLGTFGFAWQTKAQNGGTGKFNFWKDNIKNGSDTTYTTGGDFSIMDTHQYVVFFSSETSQDIEHFAYWGP